MDEVLGIGEGLLQRCCFFGQHSHTLQSLLGLTDVKFKSELSFLVDTAIWVRSTNDVRTRERADKARANELAVEMRVRGEELERLKNEVKSTMEAVIQLEEELVAAQKKVGDEMGKSREQVLARFGGESLGAITLKLQNVVSQTQSLQKNTIAPLRSAILEAARAKGQKTATVDNEVFNYVRSCKNYY
jgi:hypothetical protein